MARGRAPRRLCCCPWSSARSFRTNGRVRGLIIGWTATLQGTAPARTTVEPLGTSWSGPTAGRIEWMLNIGTIVMGATDVQRATHFWCEALGYVPWDGEVKDGWTVLVPANGSGTALALGHSRVPVQERPRVHLDPYARDAVEQEAEVARLVSLGAERVAWDSHPDDADFVVLADPIVLTSGSGRYARSEGVRMPRRCATGAAHGRGGGRASEALSASDQCADVARLGSRQNTDVSVGEPRIREEPLPHFRRVAVAVGEHGWSGESSLVHSLRTVGTGNGWGL